MSFEIVDKISAKTESKQSSDIPVGEHFAGYILNIYHPLLLKTYHGTIVDVINPRLTWSGGCTIDDFRFVDVVATIVSHPKTK